MMGGALAGPLAAERAQAQSAAVQAATGRAAASSTADASAPPATTAPANGDDPLAPVADPELERHRPGRAAEAAAPVHIDPNAVIPIQLQDLYGCVPELAGSAASSPCTPPVPDRWRLAGTLGLVHPRLIDPYNQNVLKGDIPIFGTLDWFFIAGLVSDTVLEPRSFPVPTGVATSNRAGENDPFGRSDSLLFSQTFLVRRGGRAGLHRLQAAGTRLQADAGLQR